MIATVSRRRWIWIAGWLLLFAFVVVAFRNVDWRKAAHWPGWPGRVLEFLSRAATDLEALRRPHIYTFAVALGGGKKLAEGLGILAVLMALGVAVPALGTAARPLCSEFLHPCFRHTGECGDLRSQRCG